MKYLIQLEGNSEKAFIELLIDKGLFKINVDDMLDLRPHQKRQLDSYLLAMIRQLDKDEQVKIMRIGDKMSDKLKIPKDIKNKIHSIEKYCTKPEFEIIIIISEGLYEEYQKVKSVTKPCIFAKSHIKYNGQRYNGTQTWIRNYFEKLDLLHILKEYKEKCSHSSNEFALYDICIVQRKEG